MCPLSSAVSYTEQAPIWTLKRDITDRNVADKESEDSENRTKMSQTSLQKTSCNMLLVGYREAEGIKRAIMKGSR